MNSSGVLFLDNIILGSSNLKILKAMTIIQKSEEKAILNGAVEVSEFKGAVRTDELNTLQEGDVFTIPAGFRVLEAPVGNSGRKAQFIVVDVNGEAKNFYPSSLTKNLAIVDDSARPTGKRAKTAGAVCDWFKQQTGVNQAMRAMEGCTLKIAKVTPYQTRVFGSTTETQNSNFMTVEWEGEARPKEIEG